MKANIYFVQSISKCSKHFKLKLINLKVDLAFQKKAIDSFVF